MSFPVYKSEVIISVNEKTIVETAYKDYCFSEMNDAGYKKIYRLSNETGTGEMSCYNLIEGFTLSYNNLNMESSYQKINPCEGIIQIDHCLDGCYEFKLKNNERAFVGKGDFSVVDLGKVPFESSGIPMKRYTGLTVFIDIEAAQNSVDNYFPFAKINIREIMSTLCKNGPALVIKSRKEINHILSELYTVSDEIRIPYSIIKIIELLLFLSLVKTADIKKIPTFSEPIYEATQACYKALVENPFDKYSISELAKKYAISESSLKRCFMHLTGQSIGSFIKNTCLEEAARLLIDKPHITVGEVADFAGYLNPGKFTAAFKAYFGVSPQQYRKTI